MSDDDDDDDDNDDCNDGDDCPDYTVTRLVSLYRKIIGHIINVHDLHRLIIDHVVHTGTCLDRFYGHDFFMAHQPPVLQDLLIHEIFLDHTRRCTTVSRTPLDE